MRDFTDLPDFYRPGYTTTTKLSPEQRFLAERCAQMPNGHWLIKLISGTWETVKNKKATKATLYQHWAADPQHQITADDIDRFMTSAGAIPQVQGCMCVPSSTAPAIEHGGAVYVNTWLDTIMKPNPGALQDIMVRTGLLTLMRMLRESLCSRPGAKTIEEMLAIANGNDPDELEFRFMMSWLAAPIQTPGLNMQSNMWLLGDLGGSGKGTLNLVMRGIYGSHYSALINPEEFEKGGWTDQIAGKLWIAVDEIKNTTQFDWNTCIKRNSCERIISIRKRSTDAYECLNNANWMFMSNPLPGFFDAFDRRNTLIATTSDPQIAKLAQEVRDWIDRYPNQCDDLLGAFVQVLHNVQVDKELIRRAPDTLLKTEVQEASSPELDGVYWLRNDPDYYRDQWLAAHDYVADYARFMHLPAERISPRKMGGILAKLAREGHIQRRNRGEGQAALYFMPSAKFPAREDKVVPFRKP